MKSSLVNQSRILSIMICTFININSNTRDTQVFHKSYIHYHIILRYIIHHYKTQFCKSVCFNAFRLGNHSILSTIYYTAKHGRLLWMTHKSTHKNRCSLSFTSQCLICNLHYLYIWFITHLFGILNEK